MNSYNIEITETLQKTISILADSKEEAYKKAKILYDNASIILCVDDYIDTEFRIINI